MSVLQAFVGVGTAVNVVAILVGSALGLVLGNRLGERTRSTLTDVLGLVVLVIGALSIVPVTHPELNQAVGHSAGFTVILIALLLGGLIGSELRLEDRLAWLGDWLRRRFPPTMSGNHHFVDGFVTATLVFCVGPLAILGSLSDGLGRGADQLFVKSILDGFASIAFASALGAGVAVSALAVALYQGLLTLLGYALGSVLPTAEIDALTVTGGIVLLGLGLRLLDIKQVKVADLLPALILAPAFVALARLL